MRGNERNEKAWIPKKLTVEILLRILKWIAGLGHVLKLIVRYLNIFTCRLVFNNIFRMNFDLNRKSRARDVPEV